MEPLNSDSQISDFTKETIKKLKKGHLIITTGRPYRMSKDFFYHELGF